MINSKKKFMLVVVAKAPEPEKVKTRLFPNLTPVEATSLYRCFIQDRIKEICRLTDIDLAISYTPADSREFFTQFISNGFQLFPQRGKDLGERLNNIFADKLNQGYSAVSIIDSDTPDLPRSIVRQSFQLLASDGVDAVFGPCHDGGYYLVGMRRPHLELFRDINWSTETVLQETLAQAEKYGIRAKLLKRWNDLDTFEDLLEYYHKHKDKPPDQNWTGCATFNFLSRMKRVTDHL
ncbi:MAG: TIGR04282 family arsenosugar biosynthesis glycosyltransferase [Deltaproteobacteria bacterium]|nr:TIGR04282 family arsenosugar biosynthesis glycosyltransferase [Deltaproteobacteria bacterium]